MAKRQFKMRRCLIAGVDAVEAETRHAFPRHTHEQFGIGVIHRGAQKSLSGRGMVEAGAGDTITVNPGEVHDGAPIGDAGRSWRMLYFDPPLIADAARDLSQGRTSTFEFAQPVIADARIAARFGALFSAVTAGGAEAATPVETAKAVAREERLLMLLAEVMRGDVDRDRSVPDAISMARSRIDDDPTATVTLSDLARDSGLSRFQLLRAFARATGLTPHAYLVQRRVDAARRLIRRGTPLAEAAAACGFSDQSHMTRIFTRKYGISPGAYAEAVN
ncbi:AraC family transcriptional regulator [Mesorhizobium sp. WSM2239]|uniref:AraC family transcriptional regulator n=2 Tax=unclassified Mesorhizobium TaxID=325217 RepID=A0AAU8D9B4_9HYPH